MNKRQLHHLWTKIRWIKPIYILILAVALTVICIVNLRSNNEHMIKLRNAVYSADKNGGNVEAALQQLRAYVTTHMNTNLDSGKGTVYPPIQLKYTYQHILQAESQAAVTVNADLYTAAQTYCQQQDPVDFSGRNRVPCIEQYVETHDTQLATIPTALYEFSFITPTWSADVAGWSLVFAAISWVLFIVVLIADLWFRRQLK